MAFWFEKQQQLNAINKTQIDESYSINKLENNTMNNGIHHQDYFIKESESSDSKEEDEDIKIGEKKLSNSKSTYISNILELINSKRKTILKGLQFAFKNISSAKDIIALISSSFLHNKSNIPAQLCHLYLINDILFNSQNPNLKFAWIYKELIHDSLPELFYSINDEMRSDDLVKEHISQLMKIWNSWNAFIDEYLIGLAFPMRKPIDDKIIKKYQFEVKDRLEKYEDTLLEIYSGNNERLKEIALANGISNKIPTEEIISRLVSLKEFLIYKEKEIDSCDNLNQTITRLQSVLDIMKNGYHQLNPLDLNGIVIHIDEYEYFGLSPNDPIPNKEERKNNDIINSKEEDDIDGEPI